MAIRRLADQMLCVHNRKQLKNKGETENEKNKKNTCILA